MLSCVSSNFSETFCSLDRTICDTRLIAFRDGLEREFLTADRRCVLIYFDELPSRLDYLDKILYALASLVMDIFPERPAGNSPAWFEQARRMIIKGKMPILDVPYEQNIREFALIAGDALVLLLVIKCKTPDQSDVDFFMNKAQWLAACANAKVLISFTPSESKEDFTQCRVFSNIAPPNFFSLVERILWERMQKDEALTGKFSINMPFKTVLDSEIIPDFFCSEVMLSVEVDGYTYHCGKKHFVNDRQRDYEMLLSGCTTLRIPAKEVLTDVDAAVKKVRNVFHFLKDRRK